MSLSPDACRSPDLFVGADASLAPEALRPMLPTLVSKSLDGETATLQLRLDPELVWFAGHFPGATPLPGAATPASSGPSRSGFRVWRCSNFSGRCSQASR